MHRGYICVCVCVGVITRTWYVSVTVPVVRPTHHTAGPCGGGGGTGGSVVPCTPSPSPTPTPAASAMLPDTTDPTVLASVLVSVSVRVVVVGGGLAVSSVLAAGSVVVPMVVGCVGCVGCVRVDARAVCGPVLMLLGCVGCARVADWLTGCIALVVTVVTVLVVLVVAKVVLVVLSDVSLLHSLCTKAM